MTCGIYKLNFAGTDKVYIGQSVNIERRFAAHILSFKNSTAANKLMSAYITYGFPSLSMLLVCSQDNLNLYENLCIKAYDSCINGFNTLNNAEDLPNRHLDNDGSSLLKYTKDQIIQAFNIYVNNPRVTAAEISTSSGISTAMVFAMLNGSNYTWLKDLYPDLYSKYITNRPHGNSAEAKGIIYPKVLSPTGEVFTIGNRSKFAKEHNLDCGALGRLLRKVAKSHKGWKLCLDEQA